MKPENALELLGKLPRASLGFFPTPLQFLPRLSDRYGVNIYLKRDDFSGMSLFGGNKIRKLEYLMGDALGKGCDTVFTYGATQSNHAMQTATAARRCGLDPVLYLVCVVKPNARDVRANLLLDTVLGAEIVYVPTDGQSFPAASRRSMTLAGEHMARLEAEGHKCYDIPTGGANDIGSCGFVGGFVEAAMQCEQMGFDPDYLFTATGSGGTMAGLVAGRNLLQSDVALVGISVWDQTDDDALQIAGLAERSLSCLGIKQTISADCFSIDSNYYKPGYEMPNEAANDAIRQLARNEGILLDPVYSGKAFCGMLNYIESGRITKGSNVLFWHTGGATALFAEREIVGSLATR